MRKGYGERATRIGTYPSLTFWICPVFGRKGNYMDLSGFGRKGNYIDLSGLLRNDNYIRLSGLQPFALCPKRSIISENVNFISIPSKCQLYLEMSIINI